MKLWGDSVDIATSVGGIPIRLTEERWVHIVENKPYMRAYYEKVLVTIENPSWILRGYAGALVNCNSYIAFAVHGSRTSPRTARALTVHPEPVEGFFELGRESSVTVH